MDAIKNYKVKDFNKLDPEECKFYISIFKRLPKKQTKKPLLDLPFADVFNLVENLQKKPELSAEVLSKLEGIKPEELDEMRVLDFFPLIYGFNDQIENALKLLESLSSGGGSLKWELVGGSKRMAKFGIYNFLVPLAEKFGKRPSDLEKWSFSEIIVLTSYTKELGLIEKEMNEIKTKKK